MIKISYSHNVKQIPSSYHFEIPESMFHIRNYVQIIS